MVKEALRIWIGTRMAQEFFTVQEGNELGIAMVQDQQSVHDQQCPVPPVLDHQLDVLMIIEMIRMKSEVLDKMRRMIEDRRRNQWYELCLTMFIFLSNLQYVFGKQQRWWKLHFDTVSIYSPHHRASPHADLGRALRIRSDKGSNGTVTSSCNVTSIQPTT